MEKRGKDLAARAAGIWPALAVDMEAVKEAELEDRKAQAANYSLEKLEFDAESKTLFDLLRPQIVTLGDDVIELCMPRSVTYRVYDFFMEVIPRKRRLLLILNLDYEDCDDPTQRASDATKSAFIPNASESGGVLLSVESETHVMPAMHLVRQGLRKGVGVVRHGLHRHQQRRPSRAGDLRRALEKVLGWESVYAWNDETFGPAGTLGRADTRETVLTRDLRAALRRLNPQLPPAAIAEAVGKLRRRPDGLEAFRPEPD